jgi:hypothetical protein
MTKNSKIFQKKTNVFFLSKIAISLNIRLHEEGPRYSKSLQTSKEKTSTSKQNFSSVFFFSVGHFCLPGAKKTH